MLLLTKKEVFTIAACLLISILGWFFVGYQYGKINSMLRIHSLERLCDNDNHTHIIQGK